MKLVNLRLKNFRCYLDETEIPIDNMTVLVGKNDSGKSAILEALDVFFRNRPADQDDASKGGDNSDVRIICEFEDLPEEIILDYDFPTNLREEYLLNEKGRLEIHQVWNCNLKKPKISATYASAVHPSVQRYHDLLMLKINDLKNRANDLGLDLNDVDARISALIRRLIWNSADDLGLALKEIHLDEGTAKSIWDQLRKNLPAYALFQSDRPSTDQDAEAQDPMKAAVKEALKSQIEELDSIAERVEKEVCGIADKTVSKLKEMDPSLASQLRPQFSPPNWANVFKISLTDEADIPMNKRGSGIRRLILINFFRARAEQTASEKAAPNLIYAIEEPETSQHPNSQKMLINALYTLSEQEGCQVIISTHTPTLARLVPVDSLRYINIEDDNKRVIKFGDEETYRLIAKALGVLADHDVMLFIGVEGPNDINFLRIISNVLREGGEDVPDLKELEENEQIIFFPVGGNNLALWKSRLKALNRPEFHLYDRSDEPPIKSRFEDVVNEINQRDNCRGVLTGKKEIENYIHPIAIKSVMPEVDISFGDFDDVPNLVAQTIHENSESTTSWNDLSDEKKKKKANRAKKWLNTSVIESMTHELLYDIDPDGDVRSWFAQIIDLLEE